MIAATLVVAVLVVAGVWAVLDSQPATGKVSIYIKDAPIEWKHINVTFSKVQVHQQDDGDDDGKWHTISIIDGTVDLVALTNISSLLGSEELPEGIYTQIRIVVESATGIMINGTQVVFDVPSGELKTTHPFHVDADHPVKLTIDIDLEHSIVQNNNGWIFKPVLGAVIEG
jgi:hypothetical protein